MKIDNVRKIRLFSTSFWDCQNEEEKDEENLTKLLAIGVIVALSSGTTLSVMAAEVNQENITSEASDIYTDTQTERITTQELIDSTTDPVINGTDPMALNGIIQLNDGGWYYFEYGNFREVTGLYSNSAGWWVVENGKVNFDYNGFVDNHVYDKFGNWKGIQGQWYVRNGQVDFSVNGFIPLDSSEEYAYVVNGYRDFNQYTVAQGTIDGENAWWSVNQRTVWKSDEGFAEYGGKVWYFSNGKIDFTKSGTYTQDYMGLFYFHIKCEVVNGQVISMTVQAVS